MIVRTLLYGVALCVCTTFVHAGEPQNPAPEERKHLFQRKKVSPLEAQTSDILKVILGSLYNQDTKNLRKASPVLWEKIKRFLVTEINSSAPPEFFAKLSQMPAVERIILGLPAEALQYLRGLKESKVKTLQLAGSGDLSKIGPEGAKVLAELLPATLKWLVLEDNAIGDGGAIALANNLSRTAVTYLDLENNQMGPAGAEAIAKAMPGDFLTINLNQNKIGDEGAIALAEHLIPKIRGASSGHPALWLKSNGITDVGANALLEALISKAKEGTINRFFLNFEGNATSETPKRRYLTSGVTQNIMVGFGMPSQ